MRFYNRQHRHYCGIDLHVKTMYVCILDTAGQVLVHRNVASTPEDFLEVVAPYRDDLGRRSGMYVHVVLARGCLRGRRHPLRPGPCARDESDPRQQSEERQSRLVQVRKRGQLLAHIQNTRAQYDLPAFGRRLAYPANREGVREHFPDPSVRKSIDVDLTLVAQYDTLIADLELTIVREAKRHARTQSTACDRCRGIGKVLALTILYEIHDVTRFDRVQEFASYARLVKCQRQSGGKTLGTSGAKMGNVHLKWACSEAAVLFLRHTKDGKKLLATIEKKHGKGKRAPLSAIGVGNRFCAAVKKREVETMLLL